MKKICGKCDILKPLTEFNLSSKAKDRLQSYCKACSLDAHIIYYTKNKEKLKEKTRLWHRNHASQRLESHRFRTYGLTTEDYNRLLWQQNNCCAICKKRTKLVVDHNHETGKVRGLLCITCNSGVGFFKDDISILNSAQDYLLKNGVLHALV